MKILLCFLILIMLLVSARLKSQKARCAIRVASCIGFAILIAFSLNNADYHVYERNYNLQESLFSSVFEMGYSAVSFIFKSVGASYTTFNLILSSIALLLIHSTITRYCRKPEWVMILYFIYPLAMDATQYRNFLCMAILIFAIRYLVERKSFWWLRYYIFIALAVTFHNIAVIAAVVPIFMAFRRYYTIVLPIIIITGIAFVYSPLFQPTIRWVADNIFHRGYDYFSVRPGLGLFIPIGLQLGITFMVCYRQLMSKTRYPSLRRHKPTSTNSVATIYDQFDTTMVSYFLAAMIFFVFYAMTSHFFRAFRSIFILGYMVIVNNICMMDKSSKRTYVTLLVFLLAITWIAEIYPLLELVFIPFFT